MKKLLFSLVLSVLISPIAFAGFCCNACLSNCVSWCMSYSTNCQTGEIETFTSAHFFADGRIEINTDETAPSWVGMDAGTLGCDPEICQ